MLGEGELLRGDLVAGARMPSMMSPLVVTDGDGDLVLAGGSAGGSRIRPALLQVLTAVLVDEVSIPTAIAAPRLSVTDGTVHLEPGFDAAVAPALAADGYRVQEWPAPKPFFGGVSMAGRTGAAADPRRSGHAMLLT
jgi:gamma-glutamyltranspeptidase/glutathione hydrolase